MSDRPLYTGHTQASSFLDDLRREHTLPGPESEPEDGVCPDGNPCESGPLYGLPAAGEGFANEVEDSGVRDMKPPDGLPMEARRALVFILRHGVVLCSQKSGIFEAICRHEAAVRRHLSDVFLKLVLDEKSGVAFVASAQTEHAQDTDDETPEESADEMASLITRRMLPLYDTLLLLVLRKHYQDRETAGEQKIVIDIERIESYLIPFLPLSNSSKTDRKKLNGALKKMVGRKVLSSVRGSEDRFEITPVIRYVVSAEYLETMLSEYLRIAEENGVKPDETGTDGAAEEGGYAT